MTTVKLPYVKRARGRLYWQANPEMQALGFESKPLGPDGPEAQREALRLYEAWTEAAAKAKRVTEYPPGSFGAYYDRFTGRLSRNPTPKWRKMKPRTREDYDRAWVHIEPAFARKTLTAITGQDVEEFCDDGKGGGIDHTLSPSERYRTIKVLRSLFDDAIKRLRLTQPNPALIVPNPQPRGRSQIWLGSEIAQLVAGALELRHHGTALAIMLAWDTLFSPVDIWTTPRSSIKRDRAGWYIERARTKTAKGAFGALTTETAFTLGAYVAALPFELAPDAPVIRQRNGHAYRSKDTFGDDFRAVRTHVFGSNEKRQFLDIRRSGNVEADAAGADKATMAELLANTIDSSKFLDDTYTPPTVAKARQIHVVRQAGRERLAAELERVSQRSDSAA